MRKRISQAKLLAEAARRIRDIGDRDWHITVVLYLGMKPEQAAEIKRWASEQP